MKGAILNSIIPMEFDQKTHSYYFDNGKEKVKLRGVSSILDSFEQPFDAEMISYMMARKQVRESIGWKKGDPDVDDAIVQQVRADILQGWENNKNEALDHGTNVDKIMERAVADDIIPGDDMGYIESYLNMCKTIYKEYTSQTVLGLPEYGVAGTTDMVGIRKCKELVIDVSDFKTGRKVGITFDSMKEKEGKIQHNNRFLTGILSHHEQCKFTRYALQISLYAYMLEVMLKARIGKLSIEFIQADDDHCITGMYRIPVNYLRTDVINILKEVGVSALLSGQPTAIKEGEEW